MATDPIQFIRNIALPNSAAALGGYAVPANSTDKIYEIVLHNSHTAAVRAELWLVPSGGSAAATNKIFAKTINVDETYQIGLEQRLATGTTIHGVADTAAVVSVHAAGDRVTL